MQIAKNKEFFSSRLGFILSASGAAVGLGNIQRFPYLVSQGGGALFVLIYLGCLLIIGIPLILVEFSIGAATQKNPVDALNALGKNKLWGLVGFLGIATAFFIFSYYLLPAAWTLGYCIKMISGEIPDFNVYAADPINSIPYIALLALVAAIIVSQGLKKGIERFSKILMPLLVVLLIILIIFSISLPGSTYGLQYYLSPNFSELSPKLVVFALGQAFFSLCIGEAVLLSFAGSAKKNEDMVASAGSIALFDTLIALFAGLIIFPALFSFGQSPEQGVGLIYQVMPALFLKMSFGKIFGVAFFSLLLLAAMTTLIALLEMPVNYLVNSWGVNRKLAAAVMATIGFVLSLPSAFSKGASEIFSNLSITKLGLNGFFEIMDFLWGSLGMVISGLLLSIFVGWVWGCKNASHTLSLGSPYLKPWVWKTWGFLVKYVSPIAIIIILLSLAF
jgi:neurotransmitter:Na+ symporter, NSS family